MEPTPQQTSSSKHEQHVPTSATGRLEPTIHVFLEPWHGPATTRSPCPPLARLFASPPQLSAPLFPPRPRPPAPRAVPQRKQAFLLANTSAWHAPHVQSPPPAPIPRPPPPDPPPPPALCHPPLPPLAGCTPRMASLARLTSHTTSAARKSCARPPLTRTPCHVTRTFHSHTMPLHADARPAGSSHTTRCPRRPEMPRRAHARMHAHAHTRNSLGPVRNTTHNKGSQRLAAAALARPRPRTLRRCAALMCACCCLVVPGDVLKGHG